MRNLLSLQLNDGGQMCAPLVLHLSTNFHRMDYSMAVEGEPTALYPSKSEGLTLLFTNAVFEGGITHWPRL